MPTIDRQCPHYTTCGRTRTTSGLLLWSRDDQKIKSAVGQQSGTRGWDDIVKSRESTAVIAQRSARAAAAAPDIREIHRQIFSSFYSLLSRPF